MADVSLSPVVPQAAQLVKRVKDVTLEADIDPNDVILRAPLGLKRIDEIWLKVPFTYAADGAEVPATLPDTSELRIVGA